MSRLAIGLMSGTSCDGVSAALVAVDRATFRLVAFHTKAYPLALRAMLLRARELTIPSLSRLSIVLGERLAMAALDLLRRARVSRRAVTVVGSHGHTVYHGPDDATPSTLQIGEPAIIAERIGLPVVSNFRMRDVAAGGQGAPLVPYFDHYFFGHGRPRALQNIGGIANVTVVGRHLQPLAFDTGPGNCLIDAAARHLTRGRLLYDRDSRLAAQGRIDLDAVRRLWRHPYFLKPPPKSTGPELFNEQLLRNVWGPRWARYGSDVVATLTYFTAYSIAESYRRFVPTRLHEVVINGGGALNPVLMRHLSAMLSPIPVRSSLAYGLPPQAKEPVAFAFLALRAWLGQPNHLPLTTGARHRRLLGTLIPPSPS